MTDTSKRLCAKGEGNEIFEKRIQIDVVCAPFDKRRCVLSHVKRALTDSEMPQRKEASQS